MTISNPGTFRSPEIRESIDPDRVTLILEIDEGSMEASSEMVVSNVDGANYDVNGANSDVNDVKNDVNSDVNDIKNDVDSLSITESERWILYYLESHSTASIKEVADYMKVSKATVDRAIKVLKDKGLLRREGSKRKPEWLVSFKK